MIHVAVQGMVHVSWVRWKVGVGVPQLVCQAQKVAAWREKSRLIWGNENAPGTWLAQLRLLLAGVAGACGAAGSVHVKRQNVM